MKIVLNSMYGGFSISKAATEFMAERGDAGAKLELRESAKYHHSDSMYQEVERDNPLLIEAVEALGNKANGGFASLVIEEVDESHPWYVEEYDGTERVVYFGEQRGVRLMCDKAKPA